MGQVGVCGIIMNDGEVLCSLRLSEGNNELDLPKSLVKEAAVKDGDIVFFTKSNDCFQMHIYKGVKDDSRSNENQGEQW
jgi:hypothetical protein